jgi:DNA-binding MarR family transcriptional regulator
VPDDRPLATLLSQVLIAFTIEFDNEFERQMMASPYRPFLVSIVMWANFMRFVPADGIKVRELASVAGASKPIHPSLPGMERWGYVSVQRDAADNRPKPPRADYIVRPGLTGQKAQEIWQTLPGVIEDRWRERFGADVIDGLTESVRALVHQIDVDLPHYLPVIAPTNGFFAVVNEREHGEADEARSLPTLLSQALLAFTIDFERDSELSLPMSANFVRVLDEKGVPVRDLPRLSGVSKEAISMSLRFLEKNGYVSLEPDPNESRTKLARLTPKGLKAQNDYHARLAEVEELWRSRFGEDTIRNLRESIERVIGERRFPDGLVPHEGGWRARKPYVTQTNAVVKDPQDALPHYPMVLHRGGWPDGS